MYIDYFKLNDYPFRITPDTDYLYMSPAHSRAKAYMEYAIFNREGFVVITGEIGSGKTTLIKKLLSEINEDIIVAKIFQTQLNEVEILQSILVEFGINPFSAKKVELLNMLNQFLVDSYLNNKQVLLIIDDAQNLSKRVLQEITMLSAVETQKEKILHVIIVGQPELNNKLEADDMEQLLQRVSLRYHVRALTFEELVEYINHRTKVAGSNRSLFHDEVFPEIYKYTGGIPRLINTLCDTALTCVYADNKSLVASEDISAAISELNWKTYEDTHKSSVLNEVLDNDNNEDFVVDADGFSSLVESAYGSIASRALVEISRQLKRVADLLENKKT